MQQYIDLVNRVVNEGESRGDRTGTGTHGIFGHFLEHDLKTGFPLMTHKKMGIKSIAAELVWFLAGQTGNQALEQMGSTIWQEWADDEGRLGPIYGAQWRGRDGAPVDQIANLLYDLDHHRESRRLLVLAWNPAVLPESGKLPHEQPAIGKQALPACHFAFQMYVNNNDELDLMFHLRSSDVMLGAPYNIASYSLLVHLFAQMLGYTPGKLCVTFGDTHIYQDHLDSGGVAEILKRPLHKLPTYTTSTYFDLTTDKKDRDHAYYARELDRLFLHNQHDTLREIMGGLSGYTSEPSVKFNVSV